MRLKTRADAADAADNEVGLVAPKSSANRKSSFNGGEGLKSEKFTTKIFLRNQNVKEDAACGRPTTTKATTIERRDCRRRAEKQNNNGRQGDCTERGWWGWLREAEDDGVSKGSSGSCDSLGPTLMYATTVWQRCVISLSMRTCMCVCCCWGVRPAIRTFQPFFALAGKNCVKCEIHSVSWWCSYVLPVLVLTQPYIP